MSLPYQHIELVIPKSVVDYIEKALWCLQTGPKKYAREDTAQGHLERALELLRGKSAPAPTAATHDIADRLEDLADSLRGAS